MESKCILVKEFLNEVDAEVAKGPLESNNIPVRPKDRDKNIRR